MSDTVSIKMNDDCPTGHNCLFSEKLFELSDEITRLRADLASEEQRIDLMRKDSIDLRKTLTELRADLAAVTAERDRMREALGYYAEEDYNGYNGSGACARAAIEGVTEPASPWLDIESAPKDGNSIEVWDESPGAVNPAVVFWENGVWVYADNLLADAAPDGALPSHWRQRSEPPR